MMVAYICIKMSIVAFYRRLFVVHKRSPFGVATLVTQVVILLWGVAFVLLVIFDCGTAVWANWASTPYQEDYCPIAFTSEYGLTVSDLILDAWIFLMPIPLVCTCINPNRTAMLTNI